MAGGPGAGVILHMVITIKENAKLLRKRKYGGKKPYDSAWKETALRFPKSSKEAVQAVRNRIRRQRLRSDLLLVGACVIGLVLVAGVAWYIWPELQSTHSGRMTKKQQEWNAAMAQYDFYLRDGDEWLHKKHYHNAQFQYNKALEIFPNGRAAHFRRAFALVDQCQHTGVNCDQAKAEISRLKALDPELPQFKELQRRWALTDSIGSAATAR